MPTALSILLLKGHTEQNSQIELSLNDNNIENHCQKLKSNFLIFLENIFKRFYLDFVSLLDKEMTGSKGRSSVTVDSDRKFEQFLQRL